MSKLIFLIGVLMVFIMSCSSTSQKDNSKVRTLLPEGTHQFEVLDSVETTPRQTELTEKFQKAYQTHMDVFNAYFEKIRNKENVEFPRNDILTKEELNEFMDYSKNIKLLPSGALNVTVKYSKNKISFQSSGKLEILNYIEFDISKNVAKIENYILPFKDSTKVSTTTNALQDSWKGFTWEFIDPKDIEMPTSETIHNVSIKRYKLTLGTLDKTNKTFMTIKGQELKDGQKLVDFEIPIRMK
jgi:hypothetical protein